MELAQWQDRIEYVSAGYADHYGVDRTTEWVLLKLAEEVGELVQAHLSSSGQGATAGARRTSWPRRCAARSTTCSP